MRSASSKVCASGQQNVSIAGDPSGESLYGNSPISFVFVIALQHGDVIQSNPLHFDNLDRSHRRCCFVRACLRVLARSWGVWRGAEYSRRDKGEHRLG